VPDSDLFYLLTRKEKTYRTWASKAAVKRIAASVQPLPEQQSFLSYCHEEKDLSTQLLRRQNFCTHLI
jgi:hypothetical protein